MITRQVEDGSWLATGMGYDRYIVAEGGNRAESVYNWNEVFGEQYAKAQVADALSLVEAKT